MPSSAREWLIQKGGYFYRPNKSGYTTSKLEAGRYTKEDAEREAAIEPWQMSAVHESEVPDPKIAPGYRILAPDALDPVTLERAAEIADDHEGKPCGYAFGWTDEQREFYDCGQIDATASLAAKYRSLKQEGGGE